MTMRRRSFISTLAVAGVGQVLAQDTGAASRSPLVRTPFVLMAPRADGIEAVWAVSRLSRGRLEWTTAAGECGWAGMDAFGFVPQGETVIRVRLDGLKPGTTYRVRAHTTALDDQATVISGWKSFRTLDPSASSTRFVMWNDTHRHDDTLRAFVRSFGEGLDDATALTRASDRTWATLQPEFDAYVTR